MSIGAAALNSIGNVSTLAGAQQATGNSSMNEQDFLQLLITELQNQDPTNPLDPTSEASQLAQFSSLQATNNLDSEFTQYSQMSELTQGATLIGKNVTVTSGENTVTGTVQSVQMSNGNAMLQINNQLYPMSGISNVS